MSSTAAGLSDDTRPRAATRAGAMRACARLATELRPGPGGAGRTCLSVLASDAPLLLRPTLPKAPEPWAGHATDVARVSLGSGAGGPLGGDLVRLEVRVGAGSSLVLAEVSPTLVLPGPHGERSELQVRIEVESGATLVWLAEPVIAAAGSDHVNDVRVHLDEGARLLMRDELLLGRHGESGGRVVQRVSVRLAGRALYRQDLDTAPPGGRSPVVLGDHRAVGSIVVVEPGWADGPPAVQQLSGRAALLPLPGPGVVVTAVAPDNLALRRQLEEGLAALGAPWDLQTARQDGTRT